MKKIFVICFILIISMISQSYCFSTETLTIFPTYDSKDDEKPPKLRSLNKMIAATKSSVNLNGLKNLKASGSGQFSEKNFLDFGKGLSIPPRYLVVFDLRQESHGFVNGKPVSWTDGNYNYANLHKGRIEIESDESQRLKFAAHKKRIVINPSHGVKKISVLEVKTERDFVEKNGSFYFRLPVTDHNRPTDEVVDQFVDVVKKLPPEKWVHFHCKAGKGRTTMFLTLYDMMKNAHQVNFKDILARQQLLGGSNLFDIDKKALERKRAAEERLRFLQRFYQYCRDVPNFDQSWSAWIQKQHTTFVQDS